MAFLFIPTSRKAEITLQGLRVTADQAEDDETVFPWASVSALHTQHGTAGWYVLRETGEFHDLNGRRLLLRLKSARENRIARRAQRRALRNDWRRCRISITENLPDARLGSAVIAALALACLILSISATGPGMIRAWQSGLEFTTLAEQILLRTAAILGIALFAGLPLLLGGMMVRRIFAPTATRVRIDPIGIRATQRNGEDVEARWMDLHDIRSSIGVTRLDFEDGLQIVLTDATNRTRTALAIIREELLPEKTAAEARRTRSALIRAAVIWVFGAAAAGALAEYTARDSSPVSHPGVWIFLTLVGASALVAGVQIRKARPLHHVSR